MVKMEKLNNGIDIYIYYQIITEQIKAMIKIKHLSILAGRS